MKFYKDYYIALFKIPVHKKLQSKLSKLMKDIKIIARFV